MLHWLDFRLSLVVDDDKNVLLYTNCSITELKKFVYGAVGYALARQFDPNTNVAVLPNGFVLIVPFNR